MAEESANLSGAMIMVNSEQSGFALDFAGFFFSADCTFALLLAQKAVVVIMGNAKVLAKEVITPLAYVASFVPFFAVGLVAVFADALFVLGSRMGVEGRRRLYLVANYTLLLKIAAEKQLLAKMVLHLNLHYSGAGPRLFQQREANLFPAILGG